MNKANILVYDLISIKSVWTVPVIRHLTMTSKRTSQNDCLQMGGANHYRNNLFKHLYI